MRHIILTLTAFFFFSSFADAAQVSPRHNQDNTPEGTQAILDWADSQIDIIHSEVSQFGPSSGGDSELTVIKKQWQTEFIARLELGVMDLWQSTEKVLDKKHACLIEDTYKIEDRIARLLDIVSKVEALPRSQSDQDELEEYLLEAKETLRQLIYFKDALQIYGPIDDERWQKMEKTFRREVEDQFKGEVPGELSGIKLADPVYYTNTECVHEKNLGFYQTRQEFAYLLEKIEAIKQFAQEMTNVSSLFNSAKEYFTDERRIRARKMRARKQATSWFAKNIEPSMNQVGLYPVYGSDYLDKTSESADEQDEGDRDAVEKEVPENDPFDEVVKEGEIVVRSSIYLWVRNEDEWRYEEVEHRKARLESQRSAEDIAQPTSEKLDDSPKEIMKKTEKTNKFLIDVVQGTMDARGSMPN